MKKICMAGLITAVLLAIVIFIAADVSADIAGSFKVMEVISPEKVKISFYGLPVVVHLANLKSRPEAKAMLNNLIGQKEVTITFADELGTDESDMPYVYMGVGPAMARKFVNIELVKRGLADYDFSKARSARYDRRFTSAVAEAKKAKLGIWSGKDTAPKDDSSTAVAHVTHTDSGTPAKETKHVMPAAKGKVVSELNSRFYHLPACPIAKRLPERSRIRYASFEAAERAGKRPCARCLRKRARKHSKKTDTPRKGRRNWPGKLIGLKSDPTYFYSPVSVHLRKVPLSDMIGFDTLKEAKASGRKPDPYSLRLTAPPGYPLEKPEPGECIGRALPYFRPCRRAPADASGLCLECQRGE